MNLLTIFAGIIFIVFSFPSMSDLSSCEEINASNVQDMRILNTLAPETGVATVSLFATDSMLVINDMIQNTLPETGVHFLNLITGEEDINLPITWNTVTMMALSQDGKLIAVAHNDGMISLWDWQVDSESPIIEFVSGTRVWTMNFSFDGNFLAFAGDDKKVYIFEMSSEKVVASLEAHNDRVFATAFDDEGNFLVSGGDDDVIHIWDLENFTHVKSLDQHTDAVLNLTFSSDAQILYSAGADQTIQVWDVASWTLLKTISRSRHAIPIILPEQDLFIDNGDGTDGDTLAFWNLTSGSQIVEFATDARLTVSKAINPARTLLTTINLDTEIQVWGICEEY